MTGRFIISFDFDGTVTEHDLWYPRPGPEVPEAVRVLQRFSKDKRIALLLNTCREGDVLGNAMEWLYQRGINVDATNESVTPETKVRTRKPYYEIHVCDRNFPPGIPDWKAVEEYVYTLLDGGWAFRPFPFYETAEGQAAQFDPYKQIDDLKKGYDALDKNWEAMNRAAMNGICEALGVSKDTTVPEMMHEIKVLKRQAAKAN